MRFRVLVWKDIHIEFRAKQFLYAGIVFGILLILVIGMALNAASRLPADVAAGILWMSILFATVLSLNRHDKKEREMDARLGTLLAPMDRSLIYYAKWTSTSLFLLLNNLAMWIAFTVILNEPLPKSVLSFVFALVIGTIGLAGMGTFLTLVAAESSMRDVLVPILLFPLSIPFLLGLIRLTMFALAPSAVLPQIWFEVVGGYVVAFSVLPWLLFEPLMEV
jgi:heme exporter protein B